MKDICEKTKCMGCELCVEVCPFYAISMQIDDKGFFVPIIDQKKCTNCGACQKSCIANQSDVPKHNVLMSYAGWTRRKKLNKKASSGGIFGAVSHWVIQQGGVVFGVGWNSLLEAEFNEATDDKSLEKLYMSKYVQARTSGIYKKVKEALDQDKWVLFSGTPCHNHALKTYLKKEYDKLLTMDIVCHGVPSNELMQKWLQYIQKDDDKNPVSIKFRDKSPYWDASKITVTFSNRSRYSKYSSEDSYYRLFLSNLVLRSSCQRCRYATTDRVGDITVMDYWGYNLRSFKMRDYQKGVSAILVNTPKGSAIFDKVKSELVYETAALSHIVEGNPHLVRPVVVNQESC